MATANLSVESKDFTLPVVEATAGADGIVVSTLRNDGWVTLDPGFLTTAQCESKITYIDGKNSILRYRGYPIEQLCEQSDFLRHGELPNKDQYDRFISDINHRTMVGEDFRTFMGSFPRTAHPMSVMASAVNALATFYPDTTDINDSDQLDEAATIIMAKARTIVSYIFRRRRDEPMLYPDYSRGYVDDFLRMCFAVPYEPFESDPLYVHALGRLLIIHADHEQNCSTSVVRIAGSAHANLYSAVAAGINALRPRPPRVQVVRSARGDRQDLSAEDHGTRRHAEAAGGRARAVRRGHRTGADRIERRLLRVSSSVSERRLLHGTDLPCDRLRSVHVHHAVRVGPHPRLDRAVP